MIVVDLGTRASRASVRQDALEEMENQADRAVMPSVEHRARVDRQDPPARRRLIIEDPRPVNTSPLMRTIYLLK